jgi:transcriptional regulator with XRE-family HTH domain
MASNRRIPNLLKKYRKVRGYKQKDVARILDLKSASRISRWEKGSCLPSLINAFRLAALYRVMVDGLFTDMSDSLKEEIHKSEEELLSRKNHPNKHG